MDVVARESRYVTGRSPEHGGAGDSSVLTAYGVFQGMRAAAAHRWGTDSLAGRRVAVAGVGKVGKHLVGHLLDDGAAVVVADVSPAAVSAVVSAHPSVAAVGVDEIASVEADVYAPCALGGALSDATVPSLRAEIVCGAANNQLAHEGVDKLLADRGVLYAPDYCVNSGGVIQVADEIEGFSFERARARAAGIYDTTLAILRTADAEGLTPAVAADRLAERRMADIGRLRTIHLNVPSGPPNR
jgi:valine dehydrogenase (NAD+)